MNRLEKTFTKLAEQNKKAFVPYIMAGDGGVNSLLNRLMLLEEYGATAIEVGVPFSDPVADGPTIQKAGIRALENGTTLRGIINELSKSRNSVNVPIILMTYLNPIYAYGITQFIHDIESAGVDACIIPDLPLEEEDLIAPLLSEANIELIRLVTLTTPEARLKMIAERGKGFLYAVTVKGITGERNEYDESLIKFLQSVKKNSSIPVLAGFGISNEYQIQEIIEYCDGVIVGSKIVDLFQKNLLEDMQSLMAPFKPDKELV